MLFIIVVIIFYLLYF